MKKIALRLSMIALTALSIISCKKEAKKEMEAGAETASASKTEKLALEKPQVTLGFIKLTDMAPLAIAKEKGFFEDEGLFVTLEAQSNWKNVLDRVIDEQIDGSHMLAGQPIAAAVGFGRQAKLVTTFSMDLNGNGITVSNDVWSKMKPGIPLKDGKPVHPISASALLPVIKEYKTANKPFKMGMVFPVSTHNYQLRYWLAAGGINPGQYTKDNVQGNINSDVLLSVTPPPQMPATLEAGTINGYCVGEPWNQQAVAKGIGVPVITSSDIWKNHPEKVFVMTEAFVKKNPNTAIAITKALIRAGKWLDDPKNRAEAVKILSSPAYVGADENVLKNSMTGTFEYEKGDKRDEPDFNVFFKYNATYPFYSDGIWYMTQMRRWGQITEAQSAEWYASKIKEVYKPEIWTKAAELLVKEGNLDQTDIPTTDGYKAPTNEFIDGITYDGKKPLEYLKSLKIGNKN
ncbi:nitrate ABC transporter substrate-binding protein [Flavobacterium sp. L1I52]|uniref:Nitrate ABC transporter substrate-binding protein n=1 Tax=Flavobacterium pokkalii TaxID=1940408 RepID=A0ABR7UWK5_9FLAO|nr:CmpA/NrtA family ABC transporter substrate-binding protein [Flavobacterium pokkalii]MBD0726199.1 nitrate ABC transporter substrate-binding protein [Flavobacterium pokkalii]